MDKIAWHEHCVLRDDVRQDKIGLAEFAADLNAVRTGGATNVYRLPNLFFDRTYPTDNLKSLVGDVLHRLAGRGGKPVIRVQVAYGGGKTHALIALLHLAERGTELETHPTVGEFLEFSGLNQLPQARVALLPFDKFDAIDGLSVVNPADGTIQKVKTPWGALAYQLAGAEGLARVSAHETDYITPAEPILVELLKAPQATGMSTLILIDEVLTYMRGAVNADPNRLGILQDFFQMLTQAVGKVDHASLVASLISHDLVSDDPISVRCLTALENVFHRVEETAEPVSREDISELLRRRLFESVDNHDKHRQIVDAFTGAMQKLPLRASQKDRSAYNRLFESYPFHPDLLEVFYQKWTRLSKFQRTRGVLRTFAYALSDSEGTDPSPFVGTGALLGSDGDLSRAIGELIVATEEGNGWVPVLRGELEKAREDIQAALPLLKKHREIEQAVLSTFLHSQSSRQKAETTDLYALLAHSEIDQVSVGEGLTKWREISWFLKEDTNSWCLETTSNLTKMHVEAIRGLSTDEINRELVKRIKDAGLEKMTDTVDVHRLPDSPSDIPDNPDLHFVIADPEYTAMPGAEAPSSLKAFFNRTYRNNVIILAPENSRLTGLRTQIGKMLGWQRIEDGDQMNLLIEPQKRLLLQRKGDDTSGILDSVKSAYSVLIGLDEDGEIEARQLPPGAEPAFERVKAFLEEDGRLLTSSLDPDLLTPDSYFELWGEGETSKPVQGLYRMFASLPRLPRLLNREVFHETLRRGVRERRVVLNAVRPDGSQYTYWPKFPSDEELKEKDLHVIPIEHAEIHNLSPEILRPGEIPDLWQIENAEINVSAIRQFFRREDVPRLASDRILFGAVKSAIEAGLLMARSQSVVFYKEIIPDAALNDDLELVPPLAPISGLELSQRALPEAWEVRSPSVGGVMRALAKRKDTPIPWGLIVNAVNDGLARNLFEITETSPAQPWAADVADKIGLRVPRAPLTIRPVDLVGDDAIPAWGESNQSTLALIKETLESTIGVSIPNDVFRIAAQQAINSGIIVSDDPLTNELYQIRVRKPSWARHAEAHLTETEIQDLRKAVIDLAEIAPELDFTFRIAITAEGETPAQAVLDRINQAFRNVTDKLKFD